MDEFLFPVVKKISTIELFLQKKSEKKYYKHDYSLSAYIISKV